MMKMIFAATAAAFALSAAPAFAGVQDFDLVNGTGYDIHEIYVSASDVNSWQEDVLGRDILEDGDAVHISFSWAEDACDFDLKAVYDDGEEVVWSGFDLCEISSVQLLYNSATGDTTAVTH